MDGDWVKLPEEIALAEASCRLASELAAAAAADRAGDTVMFAVACGRADDLAVEVKLLEQAVRGRLKERKAGSGRME